MCIVVILLADLVLFYPGKRNYSRTGLLHAYTTFSRYPKVLLMSSQQHDLPVGELVAFWRTVPFLVSGLYPWLRSQLKGIDSMKWAPSHEVVYQRPDIWLCIKACHPCWTPLLGHPNFLPACWLACSSILQAGFGLYTKGDWASHWQLFSISCSRSLTLPVFTALTSGFCYQW